MDVLEMNFGEICRTCLKKPTDFKNINEPASNAITLAEMIKYCTSITVDDGDLLPTNLCIDCVKDVETAYKFKTKTEKVNTTLREYLQAQIESFQQTLVKPSEEVQVKLEPTEESMENIEHTFLYPEVMMESTPNEPEAEMSNTDMDGSENFEDETECMEELEKFSNDFIEYRVRLNDGDDDDDDGDDDNGPIEMLPSEVVEKALIKQKNKRPKKSLNLNRKKNFSCPVCPKRYRDRNSCIEHYRIHTGERPYECNLCGATFHRNYSYQYHITYSHTQSAPHKCHLCYRSFKTTFYLKKHLKLCNSHGCSNCLTVFYSEEALRQHQSFGCETAPDAVPMNEAEEK